MKIRLAHWAFSHSSVSIFSEEAHTPNKNAEKGYWAMFLLLNAGMYGVFCALDFFLFYIFWEVMLLPMYFLIGIWGGPRKEYAAIKFFLYTLAGSIFLLLGMIAMYYGSSAEPLQGTKFAVQEAGQWLFVGAGGIADIPLTKAETTLHREV